MLALIIILSVAFTWLAYETKYFTVRLLVGKEHKPISKRNYITENIRSLCLTYNFKTWLGVLTGWEWARDHQTLPDGYIPTIELNINGTKHKLTPNGHKGIVKEVIKIYTKPHKPTGEVYPPSHYVELGLGQWRSVKIKSLKGLELAPN